MKQFVLLFSVQFFCTFLYAQKPLSAENKQFIIELMADLPDSVEFAISILDGANTSYYGFQKIGDEIVEIDNQHTAFEIGSITKTFTGLLYANLLVNKEIKPNRKLKKDLPGAKILKKVNYASLANHTSGFGRLPDNFIFKPIDNPYKNYTVQKLAEFCKDKKELAAKPGTEFIYSNTGYALLALGMTKVLEVDYSVALQQQILDKYGLTETSTDREKLSTPLAIPRDQFGARTNYWDFWGIFGFGEIYSNTTDLSRYIRTYFDPNNLAQKRMLQSTFSKDEKMDIGIAWIILKETENVRIYHHDGGTNGFTSSLSFEPENQKGVVVLSNLSPTHKSSGQISASSIQLIRNILK